MEVREEAKNPRAKEAKMGSLVTHVWIMTCILMEFMPLPAVFAQDSISLEARRLVAASNHFTFDLYKQVAAHDSGNIVLSPFSVHAGWT